MFEEQLRANASRVSKVECGAFGGSPGEEGVSLLYISFILLCVMRFRFCLFCALCFVICIFVREVRARGVVVVLSDSLCVCVCVAGEREQEREQERG